MSAPLQSSSASNLPQESSSNQPAQLPTKNFLMKKMSGGASFCSPTDNMMSPCSQKLVQSKKRHYTKGKPLSLSSSFQAAAAQRAPSNLGASEVVGVDAKADEENMEA